MNFLQLHRLTFSPIIDTNAIKFLQLEPVTSSSIIDRSTINNFLAARPGNFLQVLASWVLNFLQLLAPRILTSYVSNALAGKLQKHGIFASCESLHVLAPLLVRALFLGCTVSMDCILYCIGEYFSSHKIP